LRSRANKSGGQKMGLGEVRNSVVPKFALVSPPHDDGHFTSRYFTPWTCHQTYAVSGSMCISSCAALPGSISMCISSCAQAVRHQYVWLHRRNGESRLVYGLD
ncbi:MAG: PrpF domain-containing protein, partial [Ardenticatenaceae bacterium]